MYGKEIEQEINKFLFRKLNYNKACGSDEDQRGSKSTTSRRKQFPLDCLS